MRIPHLWTMRLLGLCFFLVWVGTCRVPSDTYEVSVEQEPSKAAALSAFLKDPERDCFIEKEYSSNRFLIGNVSQADHVALQKLEGQLAGYPQSFTQTQTRNQIANAKHMQISVKRIESSQLSQRKTAHCDALMSDKDPSQPPRFQGYHSADQLFTFMLNLTNTFPAIANMYSIGKSTLGVDLWVMEISENVYAVEDEPSILYMANMHGDETVGRENCLRFMNELLEGWANRDHEIVALLQTTHVMIVPTLNPDGFKMCQRGNANGQDLNRDFTDHFFSDAKNADQMANAQVETKAVVDWITKQLGIRGSISISANFHGGAVVANYPWDGLPSLSNVARVYSACPDDDTFRMIASVYANNHANMNQSTEFPGGITNGAFWYPLYGGMQDWMYTNAGGMHLTVELSNTKFPSPTDLGQFWADNRNAMLKYAGLARYGIRGKVRDAITGEPVPGAWMSVQGIDHRVVVNPIWGGYYRVLQKKPTGEVVRVVAGAPGYIPGSAQVVWDESTEEKFVQVEDIGLIKLGR